MKTGEPWNGNQSPFSGDSFLRRTVSGGEMEVKQHREKALNGKRQPLM